MSESRRTRWFEAVSLLTMNRPGLVLSLAGIVVVIFAAFVPGLSVTTSRYSLVSADNPYQKRLFAFFERFGYPDTPVLVITGGTNETRRAVVDKLEHYLEKEPMFAGKVMARIDPDKIAEVMLLHHPEALSALRTFLGRDQSVTDLIEGGLPAMGVVLYSQIQALVAADQLGILMPYSVTQAGDPTVEAARWVGVLADALEATLAGGTPWPGIIEPAGTVLFPEDQGIDRQGYVVGRTNHHHLVAIFADLPGDQVDQLEPVVTKIRSIRDRVLAESDAKDIDVRLTGLPALSVDEQHVIVRGVIQSSIAAGIGIFLLFLGVFRSLRQTLMALVPLVMGVVMTLATAHLLLGQLNLVTSGFIAILLGLGIDFSVHATARYNEALRDGATAPDAIRQTLVHAGPAILTGAATTAIAFLTTTITEFTAFAELGILTALGLTYTLLATFFLLPPLLVWGTRKRMPVSPEIFGMKMLARVSRKKPAAILALGITAAVGGAVMLPRISFNVRYFDFLPAHTESAIALRQLEQDGLMGPTFAFLSAETVEQARSMTERLRKLETVAVVQTATDLIPPLTEDRLAKLKDSLTVPRQPDFSRMATYPVTATEVSQIVDALIGAFDGLRVLRQLSGRPIEHVDAVVARLTALKERLERLPNNGREPLSKVSAQVARIIERGWSTAHRVAERGEWLPSDLPELFKARFASKDGMALALYVYPSVNVWDREESKRFREDLEKIDPMTSGTAINLHEHSGMVMQGFSRAAILAGILIFLILLLDFRSLKDALLALAPLACGWLWMLGLMGALELRFDFANIVALPLVPGIGVAAGVHLMHRCRQSAAEHDGVARLEDLLSGTGAAVFVAGITTIFGFAGLMLGDYGGMLSLGLVMSIGIGSCLLGALHILPAILLLLGRVR